MISNIRKYLKEFLAEEPKNQVILLLIAFLSLQLYGDYKKNDIVRRHQRERFVTDSIRTTRHDAALLSLYSKIEECEKKRAKDFEDLYKKVQKALDEKFLETDKEYLRLNKKSAP